MLCFLHRFYIKRFLLLIQVLYNYLSFHCLLFRLSFQLNLFVRRISLWNWFPWHSPANQDWVTVNRVMSERVSCELHRSTVAETLSCDCLHGGFRLYARGRGWAQCCAQLYNAPTEKNIKLQISYVIMRSVKCFGVNYESVVGQIQRFFQCFDKI